MKIFSTCMVIYCAAYAVYGADIKGNIYDKENNPVVNEPVCIIPDAGDRLIEEDKIVTQTTSMGEFVFTDVGVGTYLLRKSERGYPARSIVVQSYDDDLCGLSITQRVNTHTLFVKVNQPLAESLIVRLYPDATTPMSDYNIYGNADTNMPTTYSFTNIYQGQYLLTVENGAGVKSMCDVLIHDNVQSFSITNSSGRIIPFEADIWQDNQGDSAVTWRHIAN